MRGLATLVALLCTLLCGCEYQSDSSPASSGVSLGEASEESSAAASPEDAAETPQEVPEELSGTWYLIGGDTCEEWVFCGGGVLKAGADTREWRLMYSIWGDRRIRLDEEYYDIYFLDDRIYIVNGSDTAYELYSAGSDEYAEYLEQQEFKAELEQVKIDCAELLERYPDIDGWLEAKGGIDIARLADADYIDESLAAGYFSVSTPQELASACWYANTQPNAMPLITLECDIDLAGYEWLPMGWTDSHAFAGGVNGCGHTIRNLTISLDASDVGFIGWETYCYVGDICFDNAVINGGSNVGVVTGQAIGGSYSNITITNSTVNGAVAGAMLGWDANASKEGCTADVIVNGEKSEFLSYNDSEKSKIVIENPVTITVSEDYTVTRPAGIEDEWVNLGWLVKYNGKQVLHRNAEDETSYQYFGRDAGDYEICLTAFVSGQYVPISNVITYTIVG